MFNFEIGIDIVNINRIKTMVETYGAKFLNKIYTQNELEEAKRGGHFYQSLAGKFAAKEAFFKTQSIDIITFKNIEILSAPGGKPYCIFRATKIKNCTLSISHEKHYAVAVAFFFKS